MLPNTVVRGGHAIELAKTEFDLFASLTRRTGKVLSKTQLLSHVWGFDAYDTNLVEVSQEHDAHGAAVAQLAGDAVAVGTDGQLYVKHGEVRAALLRGVV